MLQKQDSTKDAAFRHVGLRVYVAQPEGKDGGPQQIEEATAQREPAVRRMATHERSMGQYRAAVNHRHRGR